MSAEPIHITHEVAHVIPISEQTYRDLTDTHVPTEAERAEWKRAAETRRDREWKQRARYADVRNTATGLLRKILEMHRPDGEGSSWFTCGSCREGEAFDPVDWPCPTAALALEDNGDDQSAS